MIHTVNFSHIVDSNRIPFTKDGEPVALRVEAENKTGAIFHPEIVAYCKENNCTVSGVV